MSTKNAFAILATEASDAKVVASEKKKEEKKKAPKKTATPAKKPEGMKAPQDVRGSRVPDSAVEHKRGGDANKGPRKLSIQRSGNRPPKREFDRHDGTGRAHEGAKKQGAGRGNWGKLTDHEEKHEEGKEEEKHEEVAPKEEKPEETEEEKARRELLEKQRTVDQYRKEQKGVKTILRSAAAVEVECSVDEKNFAPIARVDLVAEQEKKIAAEKAPKKAAPAKAEKAPKKAAPKKEEAAIEISFNEGRRDHHNRESSKGAHHAKVNVADEAAFPSLA